MNLPSWVVKNFHLLWTLAGSFHARCSWSGQRRKAPASGIPIVLLVMFSLLIPRYAIGQTSGKVVDLFTDLPIEGALVTLDNDVEPTDRDGIFQMKTEGYKVAVRAQGYLRTEQVLTGSHEIKLMPFTPKALYLSFYGIGNRRLRNSALRLIQETELNALVIDVKGDRGWITHKSAIPLASEVGAQKIIIIKDMCSMVKSLKEKGVYTIARIVVFKDNPLASQRPDLAVKTRSGAIWRDREKLAWVDPFKEEVWDYNINIALEAAQCGFDEIQFDYVRFPDSRSPQFSRPNTQENRVKAICGFLMAARQKLLPYNVFLAADVFGYVVWNLNDTEIGQKLEDLAPHLDYISLMLYPSGFQFGIPGYRNPVAHPHEIVYRTLRRAQERTKLPPVRFRPWLQAFRDYAFDRRHFTGKEIKDQVNAAKEFGSNGWMLWNPRNSYAGDGRRRTMRIDSFSSPKPKVLRIKTHNDGHS